MNDFKIGLANKEDVLFQMDPYLEGIFGLSFLSLSVYQKVKDKPTIVELLKSNGKIENAVVGIWLGRAVSDNGEGEVVSLSQFFVLHQQLRNSFSSYLSHCMI